MHLSPTLQAVLVLLACMGAVLMVLGLASFARERAPSRHEAADALCRVLDSYLEALLHHDARTWDTQALWGRLQEARALKRKHFPELYAEMLEISKVHGELTTALLQAHLELHGAPAPKGATAPAVQLDRLRARARDCIDQLKRRCRENARPLRSQIR